jgi:type IV pilus assembly protein PilM
LTSSATSFENPIYSLGPVRRIERWLSAMPHPSLAVEIATTHVAAARWGRSGAHLESSAVEYLSDGAFAPSPVEPNIPNADSIRGALRRVFQKVPHRGAPLALLIPDPVVRVFILPFENLPRRADEALPLLRWRLKKSVPFDVEETVVSWMRQKGREGNLEIIAAVARQRIVREYEEIVEALGSHAGVVLSSTLITLPLLEERGSTLLVRLSGHSLTTVIVQSGALCVYRSSEMASGAAALEPQAVLDEIFPALAYFQDTSGGSVDRVRLSGFAAREEIVRAALAAELSCPVSSVASAEGSLHLDSGAKGLIQQNVEPLVGWMMNGGS